MNTRRTRVGRAAVRLRYLAATLTLGLVGVAMTPLPAAAATVPGAPTITNAAAGNLKASISFTAPASDGGSAITGYTVTCTGSGGGATGIASGTTSPIVVTGLTNKKTYTCTMVATNAIGSSVASAASQAFVPNTGPSDPPTIGTATGGNAQATVTFTAPADTGGGTISSYTVTCTSADGGATGSVSGAASPLTVASLTNGKTYTCTAAHTYDPTMKVIVLHNAACVRDLKLASDTAVAAVAETETLEEQAQAALDRHRTAEAKLRGDLTRARDSVGTRTPPAPEGRSLQDDWSVLATWAGAERDATSEELASAHTTVDELKASQRRATAAIEAACTEAGVTGPIARMNELIATAVANAVHAHDAALARLQELADLAEETARLEETIALNREMGQLLSVSGFERWLVQSALDDLLARATDRLFELSAGQFSLESEDGEFSIRDHRNADEVRNVRTLSGGETFLASLALALALAESIADLATEGGPRLESMFLDEGFGTLDPDTLDVVATTMEELSASGRLIGIVTHIRDLADRMPVRFEVHKDATTARVERVEV